eukprot:4190683-Pyramimonas_sp.AAC.1
MLDADEEKAPAPDTPMAEAAVADDSTPEMATEPSPLPAATARPRRSGRSASAATSPAVVVLKPVPAEATPRYPPQARVEVKAGAEAEVKAEDDDADAPLLGSPLRAEICHASRAESRRATAEAAAVAKGAEGASPAAAVKGAERVCGAPEGGRASLCDSRGTSAAGSPRRDDADVADLEVEEAKANVKAEAKAELEPVEGKAELKPVEGKAEAKKGGGTIRSALAGVASFLSFVPKAAPKPEVAAGKRAGKVRLYLPRAAHSRFVP